MYRLWWAQSRSQEEPALGREKGRPHRRFTGADCQCQSGSQSHVSLYWLYTLPRLGWRYSTGKGAKKQGFYTLPCLNNDVGIMSRDACYSPRSFSSWPAASLVKTPVSNDPCQRLPRAAVMTYHTSSLRPQHRQLQSCTCFCCQIRPLSWQIDAMRRDAAAEGKKNTGRGQERQARQWAMAEDT